MSELHGRLKSALVELKRLEKVQSHYDALVERLQRERMYLTGLEAKLDKEQRDVEKLEGASLQSLFRRILGDREKQLERERQEYLHVALLYNDARKSVELIEYEMDLLESKLTTHEAVQNQFDELKGKRERELLAENSATASKLRSLYQESDKCSAMLKEIEEAINAGWVVLNLLKRQEKELKDASNWGHWDMLSNGTGWIKHSAVDRARELLHKVRHALIRFEKEIDDVYEEPLFNIDLRIERIDSFVDIFFDNLITDWVVQKKIKTALDNTRNTIYQVESALRRLSEDADSLSGDLIDIETRRHTLITGT